MSVHWLILIPKRGSFDPNLKRGIFDQSKYLRTCDVTYTSVLLFPVITMTSFRVPEFVIKYFTNNSDFYCFLRFDCTASQGNKMLNVSNHFIVNWANNRELCFKKHWFFIYAETTFFNFDLENYLRDEKILNKKKMHLDAKSKHIFFISNFYAFRLFIDYRDSIVQFKRRVPLFGPGIELKRVLGFQIKS